MSDNKPVRVEKYIKNDSKSNDERVKQIIQGMMLRDPDGNYYNESLNGLEGELILTEAAKAMPLDQLCYNMEKYLQLALTYAVKDTMMHNGLWK